MIEVVNRHGAFCHGLQPGAVGQVNEANTGIKAALAARMLVPTAEAAPAPRHGLASDGPTEAEGLAMSAEIERLRAQVAQLSKRPVDDGERAQFDLFARESAAKLSERDERIAALEADLARIQADLDGLLNAPAKVDAPAPAEKPAPKSRAAREG